jgi:hypothetical protein
VQWVLTGCLLAFGLVISVTGSALARLGGMAVWQAALGLFASRRPALGLEHHSAHHVPGRAGARRRDHDPGADDLADPGS